MNMFVRVLGSALMLVALSGLCLAQGWKEFEVEGSWNMYRVATPDGWLVKGCMTKCNLTFVPDRNHNWKVTEVGNAR